MVRSRNTSGRNSPSGTSPVSRKRISFSLRSRTTATSMSGTAISGTGRSGTARQACRPRRLEVLADDPHRLGQRAGRAELDEFGPAEQERQVPGRAVVGVPGRVDLVVIGV